MKLISFGGAYSNHLLALASAARLIWIFIGWPDPWGRTRYMVTGF